MKLRGGVATKSENQQNHCICSQQSESQINGGNSCFRAKDQCGERGRMGEGALWENFPEFFGILS